MIDEADRILEIGFEEEMRQIIKTLPKDRQTMLFSATQTTRVGVKPPALVARAHRLGAHPPAGLSGCRWKTLQGFLSSENPCMSELMTARR